MLQPFNHPLFIAIKKLAPALAAGNSVIIKPSEHAPCTILHLAELAEDAGREFSFALKSDSTFKMYTQCRMVHCLCFRDTAKLPEWISYPVLWSAKLM